MFLFPAFAVFTLVVILSAVLGFVYSFTDWDGVSKNTNFVGLQNIISLLVAVLVDKKIFGRNFFKTVFFVPSLLSTAIVGFMWVYILNPVVGSLPYLLKSLNLGSLAGTDLLGNPRLAIYTVIFAVIWQVFGYKMVIYVAGLQSIPADIYEAGDIDGVNAIQKFFKITLPLMIPSITINVFLTLVNTLRLFEHVYIMTNGGPGNTTETIATMIYNVAFSANQMGYGTAVSTVLYVATLIVAIIQLKYMRKMEVSL